MADRSTTSGAGLFDDPRGEQGELEEPPNPLDLPQTFADASSFEVRDALQKLVERDLLGPWDGPEEAFKPRARGPRDRYLVGMLGPRPSETKSTREQADRQPDTESGVYGDGEAELPEVFTPQNLGKLWASSMGLTFTVGADVDVLAVRVEWGEYGSTQITTEDGKKATVWQRAPHAVVKEIRLDGKSTQKIGLRENEDPEKGVPTIYLAAEVRPRDGRQVVQIVLVNGQIEPENKVDRAWVFQSRLTVTALDGAAPVFEPVDDPADGGSSHADPEDQHLRLLYRHQLRFAVGHNVAVHAHADGKRATALETTWLPTHDVPATAAAGSAGDAELSMDALATADAATLRRGLTPLVEGYRTWLDGQTALLDGIPVSLRGTGEHALDKAREIADRIEAGVGLLTDPSRPGHADALRAFGFANRVMALQRRNTAAARIREEQGLDYADAFDALADPKNASWRPFQLAFVLLNLPAIADPAHPERAAAHTAVVDLLFFPTGGGKTEAYLGLTAFTFAIRRLQGQVGSGADQRDGSDGVAVLMRYTLRLLTAQQFQRAAALVCAAEFVRREDPGTWGPAPFRIGLWVGGKVSPNWYPQAEEQVKEAREAGKDQRVNVLQTLSCPWCGTPLAGHRDLHADETARRILLYCPNGEGDAACPFSQRKADGEGLPVLTVDEEIYRYTPALVIATVDKFAQLPWRGFAGSLFGRVREQCPRHGYKHADLDARTGCRGRHAAKGRHPAVTAKPVPRLRPPDLIIQDELHLISGALGTTVGLFEAAIDELSTWTAPGGTRVAPKIVASTATTKNAAAQVKGVFGRELAIFPPPVLDVADTFFSTQVPVTPENPGRRYLGICAHGVRLKSAEIRVAEILLLAGQTLFDRHGAAADPYMTLVGYFSATRELAGMRRYLDDDVATRVRRHGRLKDLSDRLTGMRMLEIAELTSRISSADISVALKRLEVGFDADYDTSARKRAIGAEWKAVLDARKGNKTVEPHEIAKQWRERGDSAVDVVLATSMLQVGVDVSRFGLMVVTGQPKNTAEYIQASSRVGRDARRPGLVVTLYNWTRPRDLAHYEDFEHYHSTFYRQVEALSVTPFTRRSLDRTTAGTVVAALRNVVEEHSHNPDAGTVPLDGPVVKAVLDRLLARAQYIGGHRGRDYLQQRLGRFTDVWKKWQGAEDQALGYEQTKGGTGALRGLLHRAGNGSWGDQTVAMSMRETENEINLLVPGDLSTPDFEAPDWTFGAQASDPDPEPEGDEMGDSMLRKAARR